MYPVISLLIEVKKFDSDVSSSEYYEEFKRYLEDPKVKEFIELSSKIVKGQKLDKEDSERANHLFREPEVQGYLRAAVQVGNRDGWLYGGLGSAILTFLSTPVALSSLGLASSIPVFVIALLAACLAGLSVGFVASRLLRILYRWSAENAMVRIGKSGLKYGKLGAVAFQK